MACKRTEKMKNHQCRNKSTRIGWTPKPAFYFCPYCDLEQETDRKAGKSPRTAEKLPGVLLQKQSKMSALWLLR
jgi:hypothetical protein